MHRGFITQIRRVLLGDFQISLGLLQICSGFCQLLFQTLDHLGTGCFPEFDSLQLVPLPLVLPIPGQDCLLPLNQLHGGNWLVRGVRIKRHFFGAFLFLIRNLANRAPPVVGLLLPELQGGQLLSYADDLQQRVSLFFPGCFHKLGQIQRQFFHKAVQQLLPSSLAGGVRHFQGGVFAGPLHHQPVGKLQADPGWDYRSVPGGGAGAVSIPTQRPGDGVQHRGFALPIVPADHSQAGAGGHDLHRPNSLYILQLQAGYFYRFHALLSSSFLL